MLITSYLTTSNLFEILNILDNKFHSAFNAKLTRVDAEIIAVGSSPFLGRIVIVIALTLLILLRDHVACLNRIKIIQVHDTLDLEVIIGIDEEVNDIIPVLKGIIGTSSDYYAGSL